MGSLWPVAAVTICALSALSDNNGTIDWLGIWNQGNEFKGSIIALVLIMFTFFSLLYRALTVCLDLERPVLALGVDPPRGLP